MVGYPLSENESIDPETLYTNSELCSHSRGPCHPITYENILVHHFCLVWGSEQRCFIIAESVQ